MSIAQQISTTIPLVDPAEGARSRRGSSSQASPAWPQWLLTQLALGLAACWWTACLESELAASAPSRREPRPAPAGACGPGDRSSPPDQDGCRPEARPGGAAPAAGDRGSGSRGRAGQLREDRGEELAAARERQFGPGARARRIPRPALRGRQASQGRLEQAGRCSFAVPGQPTRSSPADGQVAVQPSRSSARGEAGDSVTSGFSPEEDGDDLDGQGVAAQAVHDLERGLPLVVMGDRRSGGSSAAGPWRRRRATSRAAGTRMRRSVGPRPGGDQHVNVIARRARLRHAVRRQQAGVVDVVDQEQRPVGPVSNAPRTSRERGLDVRFFGFASARSPWARPGRSRRGQVGQVGRRESGTGRRDICSRSPRRIGKRQHALADPGDAVHRRDRADSVHRQPLAQLPQLVDPADERRIVGRNRR